MGKRNWVGMSAIFYRFGPRKSCAQSSLFPTLHFGFCTDVMFVGCGDFRQRTLRRVSGVFSVTSLAFGVCVFSYVSLLGLRLWSSLFLRFSGDRLPLDFLERTLTFSAAGFLRLAASLLPSLLPIWTGPGCRVGGALSSLPSSLDAQDDVANRRVLRSCT